MRKLGLVLIVMMVAVLFIAPVAMANSTDTTADRKETDHDQHGMTDWINSLDKKIWAGINLAGDDSYGYYTQYNAGLNGSNGMGLISDETNSALGAPSYTSPCPTFVDSNTLFVPGGCAANVASDDPQTMNLANVGVWDIPILDDMLAKMWDLNNAGHYLTQQLDILFFLDPVDTQAGFIDQTLDQDLADITGDASSYMTDGEGITQRLVSIFEFLGDASKSTPGSITNGDEYIDQWLLSYTKDVDGGDGIVSSYNQWFELDKNPFACPDCTYTYSPGHDPINKSSAEIDNHP